MSPIFNWIHFSFIAFLLEWGKLTKVHFFQKIINQNPPRINENAQNRRWNVLRLPKMYYTCPLVKTVVEFGLLTSGLIISYFKTFRYIFDSWAFCNSENTEIFHFLVDKTFSLVFVIVSTSNSFWYNLSKLIKTVMHHFELPYSQTEP